MAEFEIVRLYEPKKRLPHIVAIGGGHGLSAMLRGLKRYTKFITAIVTVADDGGGSGMLREDLGMLPPGDIRNCIMSLANTEPTMQKLLNYRFTEGSLAGQSFGNLFLAAMNGISGSFDEAVHRMGDVLAITGRVLPVTNQNVHLEAEFDNGSRCLGESKIFYAKKLNDCRIRKIRLVPEHPQPLPDALEAIADADVIVLGPGSLYTSIIPNFLVDGISEAVTRAQALKCYVLNIMTQDGETDGYTAADHIRAIFAHAGAGVMDVCIANNRKVSAEYLEPYQKEGVQQLLAAPEEVEQLGVALREFPVCTPGRYIRHNPDELARARRSHVIFIQCQSRAVQGQPEQKILRGGGGVWGTAVLQHLQQHGNPHHHRKPRLCRAAAAAVQKGVRHHVRSGACRTGPGQAAVCHLVGG